MVTVAEILEQKGSDVVSVLSSWTVRQVVEKMIEANVGCVFVEEVEEVISVFTERDLLRRVVGKVIGIFTERDLLRRVVGAAKDPDATLIGEVMSSPVRSCAPDAEIDGCFDILRTGSFRHLMVTEGTEPVGVISLRDVALVLRRDG